MVRSLAFLLVGLVVGWVLGASDVISPRAQDSRAQDRPERSPEPARREVASDYDSTAESVESPSVVVERGSGVIAGRVIDDNGRSIEGVSLEAASAAAERAGSSVSFPRDPVERARAILQARLTQRARSRTARTDAEGRFRFEQLVADWHTVSISDSTFVAERSWRRVRPGTELLFRVLRTRRVSVRVATLPGRPLIHLQVVVIGKHGRVSGGWSLSRPWMDLPPGRYEILATAGHTGEFRSKVRTIDVPERGDVAPVELALEIKPRVEVRLVADRALQISSLTVWCLPTKDTPWNYKEARRESHASHVERRTYAASLVRPGSYEILVLHRRIELARRTIQYSGEAMTIDVPLQLGTGKIRVRAVDEQGLEIVTRRVLLSFRSKTEGAFAQHHDGSWLLLVSPEERSQGVIRVSASRWGTVEIEGPHAEEAVAVFRRPCHLVVEAPETPAFDRRWDVRIHGYRAQFFAGRARINPMQPGPARLVVKREHNKLGELDLVLEPGEQRVRAPAPPMATLQIEGAPRSRIRIRREGSPSYHAKAFVGADGWADFGWVPHGRYKITGQKRAEHVVEVRGPTRVRKP